MDQIDIQTMTWHVSPWLTWHVTQHWR